MLTSFGVVETQRGSPENDPRYLFKIGLCSYQALTFPSAVDLRFSLHLPPTKLFHPSEKRANCYIIAIIKILRSQGAKGESLLYSITP